MFVCAKERARERVYDRKHCHVSKVNINFVFFLSHFVHFALYIWIWFFISPSYKSVYFLHFVQPFFELIWTKIARIESISSRTAFCWTNFKFLWVIWCKLSSKLIFDMQIIQHSNINWLCIWNRFYVLGKKAFRWIWNSKQ